MADEETPETTEETREEACRDRPRKRQLEHDREEEPEKRSERYGYGPKKCTCPVAYSLGQRRGSPVAVIAAPVLPWYDR